MGKRNNAEGKVTAVVTRFINKLPKKWILLVAVVAIGYLQFVPDDTREAGDTIVQSVVPILFNLIGE